MSVTPEQREEWVEDATQALGSAYVSNTTLFASRIISLCEALDDAETELHYAQTGDCRRCGGRGIIDSAEHPCGACNGFGHHPSPANAQHDAMEATQRVRALHRNIRASNYPFDECDCGAPYPCPTIRALDGEA